jgi:dTDP-4-dehydrorhamnose reductase
VKVLITGAGGQVGRALLKSVPEGVNAVRLDRAGLDITSEHAVSACIQEHRPDLIINTAAYTAVDQAEKEPEAAARANRSAPGYLAAAAAALDARLIHLSTDFVFDGTASRPYPVDAPTHPLSVYGTTKEAGERAVRSALPNGSVIVRTAWVYAAEGTNFVRTMLRLMTAGGSVRVVSDQVGTPTSADSLAGVIWRIAARPDLSGTFHWTDQGTASWYDFAVAIAEEGAALGLLPAGVRVEAITTEDFPRPAKRPAFGVLDKRALASRLSLQPQHWRGPLRAVLQEIAHAAHA